MERRNRIALLVAVVLLVALAGTALATRAPKTADEPQQLGQEHEEAEEAPSAEDLAHAAERLLANEVPFDEATLNELAAQYGVGGAVRVLVWANGDDELMGRIRQMRDGTETEAAMGWGQIAKELEVHPGIGSIMGKGQGNGHGRENAPGQQDRGTDGGDDSGG